MSVCCFECFKQFVCNFLYDDSYTLECWKNVHNDLLSSLFRYFLNKNLIRCQNKQYASFSSQFRVWCLCCSFYFVLFFNGKKRKKIVGEINLVIKNYESADFNKLLLSKKRKKRKKKRSMNGMNMT